VRITVDAGLGSTGSLIGFFMVRDYHTRVRVARMLQDTVQNIAQPSPDRCPRGTVPYYARKVLA